MVHGGIDICQTLNIASIATNIRNTPIMTFSGRGQSQCISIIFTPFLLKTKEALLYTNNIQVLIFLSISGKNIDMFDNDRKTWAEFVANQKYQNILADPQAKIYLIDKPKGLNSFKAVSVLRKVLNIKRVGFSGTLDPLASGLLIMATAKATKLLDYFHYLPKVYQASILFGQTSDTYDLEGQIQINNNAKEFDQAELQEVLKKFTGQIDQQAPIFSAKKIGGQKLYKLARAGKQVTPPTKKVEIHSLKIKTFSYPHLELEVTCSAGTYIRSLAYDLGQSLGTGALLADLRRIAIGYFLVDKALPLEKADKENLSASSISIEKIKAFLDQYFCQ